MSRRIRIVLVALFATAGALLVAGGALAAFPGANGKIAFTHDPGTAGSSGDIFTIDPTGQNLTPLTSGPENDVEPSYSADGERIVFSRDPTNSGNAQIWVMSHDGSGQTQLTTPLMGREDRDPTFSPDGDKIAFERSAPGSDFQIFVMNADGSGQTQLTFPGPNADEARATDPSFSPGGQIAFERSGGSGAFGGIWIMNADGSGQTRLTTGSATSSDQQPNFSPDGQRIVFFHGGPGSELQTMSANGSGQSPLTTSGLDNSPAFAPDGTKVVFSREDSGGTVANIFLVDSTGLNQNLTPLTFDPAPVFNVDASWQPLNPPSCDLTGKATQKSFKQVSVTVTCANENVTAVAEGSGKAPKAPKGAVASKSKKFTIAPVTGQVPEGTPTNITLQIPKKGKKALKKAAKAGKKGKATITATLTDDLGQSSTDAFTVKFKPKKK
jgi:Tol biopolymer transport system component